MVCIDRLRYKTEYANFVFYATICKPITFSLVNNDSADYDIFLSFTSLTPTDGDYDLGKSLMVFPLIDVFSVSYKYGDDQITLSVCDEGSTTRKNTNPIPVYLTVDVNVPGGYWLTASSDGDAIIYTKVVDVEAPQFLYEMTNTVNVTCGRKNRVI